MVVWSIIPAQKQFLVAYMPDYRKAFSTSSLGEFWGILYGEWFRKWPSEDVNRPYVEEQLRAWMITNSRWIPTAAQRDLLKASIADYRASQESKSLGDFWARIFAAWFQRWPATEIAPQGLVEKKLKAWYNNNARVTANGRQVLNLNQPSKRTRRPAPYQTFCNVYWKKPVVDGASVSQIIKREWVIEWKNSPNYQPTLPRPAPPVTFVNAVSARLFAQMSVNIRQEIFDHPDQNRPLEPLPQNNGVRGNSQMVDVTPLVDESRAREFQKAIASLPYSIEQACKQVFEKSGFVMLAMVSGPDPSQGGNILTYSFTEGTIASSGCDFIQYCANFEMDFQGKFGEFARMVFPPAERMRRALPGTEYLRNYPRVQVETPTASSAPAPVASSSAQAPSATPPTTLHQIEQEADASDSDSNMSQPAAVTTRAPRMSAYELEREANIARNNQLLEDLGLNMVQLGSKPKAPRAPRKPKEVEAATATRRSARISGPEATASLVNTETTDDVVITTENATAEAIETDISEATTGSSATVAAHVESNGCVASATGETSGTSVPILEAPAAATVLPPASANASLTSASAIVGAPAWLNTAADHLAGISADPRWCNIVAQFVEFEKSLGYLDGKIAVHMLAPGKHRPKEVSTWVKNARATDPIIKNPVVFGVQWWMWYAELQPECRKAVEGHLQRVTPENNEWTELRKGTINGIYGLLASLGWWMKAAEVSGEVTETLDMALSDVSWTLDLMARAATTKRASPDPEEGAASKKVRID
ncbi:hypothetical protein EYR40_004151 [Pleurotus pulmonarius]|nr:hypothetical protein EYR36_010604 [Pleurotus pulmonarius]KAF4588452.1 hypothetical protein EYR40_010003 [Pleurotus pulmonarius]KAF4605364.1 hypothetical protein EYR40_004148 [Pleurotus pulmonarius]KAF4605367.1 hypothetical protein EYR40_004151 [Pleurotus pulmonarius]